MGQRSVSKAKTGSKAILASQFLHHSVLSRKAQTKPPDNKN